MKNTFVQAFGLCLLFISTQAQDQELPGYIVRHTGDTVRGMLQVQGTDESARSVTFKSSGETAAHTYTPADVSAYQFNGGDLFRAITYSDTRMDQPENKTCFGKLLVTGEYDLYSFTEQEILFFVGRKDSSFYLIYDDDLRTVPGVPGNFRNELNFFAAACDAAKGDVERATYNTGGLIAFFEKVSSCANPGKMVTSYYQKAKAKVGFFGYVGGIPLGNTSQFTAEGYLRLTWPKVNQNVSVNIGFRYASLVSRVTNPNYTFGGVTYPQTIQIKSIPVIIQFNLTKGFIQPFVYAGGSLVITNATSVVPEQYREPNSRTGGAFIVGGGVEVRLLHFLWARAEWRDEYVLQHPTVGLSVKLP